MSSSTSSSRLFLGALAAGLVLAGAAFSFADESYFHAGPEFGMAMSMEDRLQDACARKAAPELLIIGDSRAVAGLSAEQIGASGVDVEKFAMGGSGLFVGWSVLDRLLDCGVRPRGIVLAYGVTHLIDSGALMQRTANFDMLKGPRARQAYDRLSQWEERPARAAAYKAVSVLGEKLSLVDLVLLRPSLRNVLEAPPLLLRHHELAQFERAALTASGGDRFYGQAGLAIYHDPLPEEARHAGGIHPVNLHAADAIAALARTHGIPASLYILPMSETAMTGVDPHIYEMAREVRAHLETQGVAPLNTVWSLPDPDFGDPSHVNADGRARVTADFLKRFAALRAGRSLDMHDPESLAPEHGE